MIRERSNSLTKWEKQDLERCKDIASGLTDDELAVKWGITKKSVISWKKYRRLRAKRLSNPISEKAKREIIEEIEETTNIRPRLFKESMNTEENKLQRMKDYEEGLTDRELAAKWEVPKGIVVRWRIKHRLKMNYRMLGKLYRGKNW